MITILTTTATIGKVIPVNVYYQSGFVEIINDTPFQLTASLPTGQTTLVAGYIYAFPIPDGGMFFQLTPAGYLSQIQTVNTVTVNAYQSGEGFNPNTYPITLVRQTPLPTTSFTVYGNVGLGGSSIILNLPVPGVGQHAYLSGFTLTADRAPAVQSCNLVIFNVLGGNNIIYVLTQTVAAGLYFSQSYGPSLIDVNTGPPAANVAIQITVNSLNLSLSGATAQLVAYGYIQ